MKIGITGPFSGPRSAYGELLKRGVERAKKEVLTEHTWIVLDDVANPLIAKQVSKRMVNEGVGVVIGHFNSACALEAIPNYRDSNIPFLVPASTNPEITKKGNGMVFRFCPNDNQQIDKAHCFFKKHQVKHILIIHDGTLYGQKLATLCLNSLQEFKLFITDVEKTHGLLPKINEFDSIFFVGTHFNSARIVNLLRSHGYNGLYLASDDTKIKEFIELAEGSAELAYVIGNDQDYEETSYWATRTLLQVLDNKPKIYGARLAREIQKGSNKIRFSNEGERIGAEWSVWQVNNNKFKLVTI
jgi:branched-chain amino acid transport system substrate-binding protein